MPWPIDIPRSYQLVNAFDAGTDMYFLLDFHCNLSTRECQLYDRYSLWSRRYNNA